MKKFLSLVLALIMTMSLVTISAGATEYKDLTDKDEIQYEEAVAVLNRIGVITGYEDGSFRPETELTRGAAAKIIVSLMIGPEAASALPNNQSPYPDVPAGHTFAGVIGYCKTAGYISGYGDGTFKPANPLTGYAFAKMLLGAIGYKANIEGFVDTGWTMNVARIGNVAGLFDRISFDGAKAVTRDEACQLALNTLKATMVDYGGTNTVVSSNGQVLTVQGSKAQYVTSNNRDINANINRRVINATNNEMTLEFGEEHFKDLRLEHDKYDPAFDVYGHPSNEWSYKKVTIGTFKLPADFTYTKQMAHLEDTAASKEKALGLRGYDTWSVDHRANVGNWSTASNSANLYMNSPFDDVTQIIVNGWDARADKNGVFHTWKAEDQNGKSKSAADYPSISEICDLTDNGVTVEVYVCPVDADFITHVVVTRTQLMEVRRVASDYISLDKQEPDSRDKTLTQITGYNAFAIDVDTIDVKDNNYDAYNVLKDLKAGDKVAVIPYTTDDSKTWEVGEAYVPEEVSGALTKANGYATSSWSGGNATSLVVGGTEYPIAEWNDKMIDLNADVIKATRKDVTLLLDKMGNALLAKDVGNADDWMVLCDYYQKAASEGGKVVWWAHGKSLNGKEDIDVNLGTIRGDAEIYAPGEIVHYDIAKSGTGEYTLSQGGSYEPNSDGITGKGVYDVARYYMKGDDVKTYDITSKNSLIPLEAANFKNAVYTRQDVEGTYPTDLKGIDRYLRDHTADADKDAAGNPKNVDTYYEAGVYSGVKFIFVGFDKNGEVDYFAVKDGVQSVEWAELGEYNYTWKNVGTNDFGRSVNVIARPAEAMVSKEGKVEAVVIKCDTGDVDLSNIILTTDTTRDEEVDEGGKKWHGREIARGSDSFKSEEDVLLDRFTSVGEFSRIVSEDEKDGTKRLEIRGLREEFDNRAIEPLTVTGILPVYNNNTDSINDKIGFRVGQVNTADVTHTVVDQSGNNIVAPPAGRAVKNIAADFMGKNDVMGDSVLTSEIIPGLIRVDSGTQWLDLRDIQDDRIDSLKELLSKVDGKLKYDLNTVKLSVLMNADQGSDGFRHAYAVAVLKAEGGKNIAATPVLDVKAGVGGVLVTGDNVIVTDSGKTITFKVPASSTVNLSAKSTVDLAKASYSWTDDFGTVISSVATATATAPAIAGEKVKLTLKVTNTDVDADKGEREKTTTMTVYIEAAAVAGAGSVTLTADSPKGFVVNAADTSLANGVATVVFDINRSDVEAANWTDEDGNKTGWLPEDADGTFDLDVYAINEDGSKTLINHANDTAIGTLGFKTVTVNVPGKIKETSKLEVKVSDVKWTTVDLFFDLSAWKGNALTPYSDATNKSTTKISNGNDPINLFLKSGTADGDLPAQAGAFALTPLANATNGITTVTTSTASASGTSAATPTVAAVLTNSAIVISGVDPVVVAVTFSAVPTVTTYAVTNAATQDLGSDLTSETISLTATPNSSLVKGDTVTVSAELSDAVAATGYPLQVVVSHPDFTEKLTFVFVNDGATATAADDDTFTMPAKAVDLAGCTYTVTEIKDVPKITEVTLIDKGTSGDWDANDEILIKFNKTLSGGTVALGAGTTTTGGTCAIASGGSVADGDQSVTVKLSTAFPNTAGDKVVLEVTDLTEKATGYANPKTTTITILLGDLVADGSAVIRNFAEA